MVLRMEEFTAVRELLMTWAMREFRVRYSQSLLGAAWAILQPLSLMIVFSVIFSVFVRVPSDGVPYPVFAYTALLPWTFFANGISQAIPSLINNMNLVSKIYFPREVLPLATLLVAFVDFLIGGIVFILLLVIYRIPIGVEVIAVPVLVAIQMALMFGISLFGAAIIVFYRDIRFIIPLSLQILMYLSPVIYPISIVPEALLPLYLLNPIAVLIDAYRQVILFQQWPSLPPLLLATIVSLLLLLTGYRYFKRAEKQFADLI